LTYTAHDIATQTPTDYVDKNSLDQGWNLLGNNTASTLDWDAVSGWTKTNVDNTLYVWDPSALNGNGEYLTWNGTTGTLGNGKIPPFQAFWIHANATSPALSFTHNVKNTTPGTFMRSPTVHEMVCVPLTLSGQQMQTTSFITFSDTGFTGADCMDAYRLEPMNDTWIELYTLSSPHHVSPLVINNLPLQDSSLVNIPLYVSGQMNGTGTSNSYTLKWQIPDNWPSGWNISLQDNQASSLISMTDNTQYIFNYTSPAVESTFAGRMYHPKQLLKQLSKTNQSIDRTPPFSIVISKGGKPVDYLAPKPHLLPDYPNPLTYNTAMLRFSLPEPALVRIDIYDLNGILIDTPANDIYQGGFNEIQWMPTIRMTGMYFIRFTSGDTVETHKLILTNKK